MNREQDDDAIAMEIKQKLTKLMRRSTLADMPLDEFKSLLSIPEFQQEVVAILCRHIQRKQAKINQNQDADGIE